MPQIRGSSDRRLNRGHTMKRCATATLGLLTYGVLVCAPTFAADSETLEQILTRTDVAHNLAFYCAQYDRSIIDRTRSTVGDMQQLMQHIRREVVSGLSEIDALYVVLRAANAARTESLIAIRKFYGTNPDEERARLSEWCEKTVVPSLKGFVASHDNAHALFEQAIEKAKQDYRGVQERAPR